MLAVPSKCRTACANLARACIRSTAPHGTDAFSVSSRRLKQTELKVHSGTVYLHNALHTSPCASLATTTFALSLAFAPQIRCLHHIISAIASSLATLPFFSAVLIHSAVLSLLSFYHFCTTTSVLPRLSALAGRVFLQRAQLYKSGTTSRHSCHITDTRSRENH